MRVDALITPSGEEEDELDDASDVRDRRLVLASAFKFVVDDFLPLQGAARIRCGRPDLTQASVRLNIKLSLNKNLHTKQTESETRLKTKND